MSRPRSIGEVADWEFWADDDHAFGGDLKGRTLYGWSLIVPDGTRAGKPKVIEWYRSPEHAMAAAIAAKYTGERGAGGTGVGTAADWFMRMIGADMPTRAELIDRVDRAVLPAEEPDGSNLERAVAIVDALNLDLR